MLSMLRSKMLVFPALTATLLAALVLVPTTSASGAVPPVAPGVPAPLNVLPSVVTGAVNAPAQAGKIALLMAAWSKTPAFWDAVRATQAGGATAPQTALVTAGKAGFKLPAFSVSSLTKVLGPVSTVATGAQIGLMVGNGTSRLLGFKDELVCASDPVGGVLRSVAAITNGVDCAGYDMTVEAIAQANSDAQAGITWGQACNTVGECIEPQPDFYEGGNRYQYICGIGLAAGRGIQYVIIDAGEPGSQLGGPVANGCPTAPYSGGGRTIGLGNASVDWTLGWYRLSEPNGSFATEPVAPSVGTADPERFLRCTLRLAGGGSVSALSVGFHESDGQYAPVVCPELPEGGTVEGWDIDLIGGPDELRLLSEETTPEYSHFQETYPECSTGACMLDLQKLGLSCFSDPVPCADWFADPAKDDKYQCRYGENAVALSQCAVYAPTFKPGAVATGDTYADPTTGLGASQPTSTPADQTGFGTGVQNPEQPRQCFPTGWGVLNPLEWVTKPVRCALEWAFVPRQSVINSLNERLDAKAGATVIGGGAQLLAAMETAFDIGASDCMGPAWHLEISFPWAAGGLDEVYYPFASCEAPMSNFASFFNMLTQGFVAIAATFAGLRYFAAVVGFVGVGNSQKGEADTKVRFK